MAIYVRWSPTKAFNYSDHTKKKFDILGEEWSVMGGDRLQEVVAQGGSIAYGLYFYNVSISWQGM